MASPPDIPVVAEEVSEGMAALEAGDSEEARARAARALSLAPMDRGVLAFVDSVIATSPGVVEATRPTADVPFGVVALHARALAAAGNWLAAVDLTLQVAAFCPRLPYAPWAVEWIAQANPTADEARTVFSVIGKLVGVLEPPLSAGALENARAALAIMRALPLASSDRRSFVEVTLLRRLREFDEAVRAARESLHASPTWISAVTLGHALRDAGDLAGAIAAFMRATKLDPTDGGAWVDLAELHGGRGNLMAAEQCCREALVREPNHALARVLLLGARAQRGDGRAARELRDIAAGQSPEAGRARALLGQPA